MSAAADFIERYKELELLRFMTCGGVDHGKSTLIGRLLFDSSSVPDDHVASARRNTAKYSAGGAELDFAMLLDGLRAEREQGITIDVAYRYFRTNKRKFIIADAPGHEQYTRNMATAASNCDLAVVLVDAREGIIEQTRRHSFIAALLGIKHLVIAVNKMDLADRDERRFDAIRRAYDDFAARLEVTDVEFIPIVASTGENVVQRSPLMDWYRGRPLLDHLENVHIASDRNLIDLRFPVQLVLRGEDGVRRLAGTIASGVVRTGDELSILPSQATARVSSISTGGAAVGEAFSPMAVALTLDRDVDVSRGDMLAHVRNIPTLGRDLEAMVVWMSAEPLRAGREYILEHTTTRAACVARDVRYRIDVHALRRHPAEELRCNEIGRVRLEAARRIAFDAYARNRDTGAFILIDRMTGETAAAGMIVDRDTSVGPPTRRPIAAESAPPHRSVSIRVPADDVQRALDLLASAGVAASLASPPAPSLARRVYERLLGYAPATVAARTDFLIPALRKSWGGPFNGQKKRAEMVREIVAAVEFAAIVETGTYRGTTTAFLREISRLPVFSVEMEPRFFEFARLRFRSDSGVSLHRGDSRDALRALASDPRLAGKRLFFYLDAHWNADLPIREELQIIAERWPEFVVLIDDFAVPDDPAYGFDDWGEGKRLTLADSGAEAIPGVAIFWPAARASEETGQRRGCVVLARGSAVDALTKLPALRR